MPNGDDAAAAGMDTVNPLTDLVKDGADEINLTRDYIAQRTSAVQPIAKGGTGATTAADARTNLGVPAAADVYPKAIIDSAFAQQNTIDNNQNAAIGSKADAAFVNDRITLATPTPGGQPIYNPHGRGNPVSTSWVAAAFNNDGRIAIQPSAERFKQDIAPRHYTLDQAAQIGALVVEYRLIAAVERDGAGAAIEVGIIADRLLDAGFAEFVVLDADRQPLSIRYEQMVIVSLSALTEVAAVFELVLERLAALEGGR